MTTSANNPDLIISEKELLEELQRIQDKVTRIEVIDDKGRAYTNWNVKSHEFSYQDDGGTLKIFINWNK